MPFLINCTNKGCGKYQEPRLNTNDNEVYCSECGKIIAGISHFTKTQMKSLGQTLKPPKSAYAIRCEKCKKEAMPKLDASNQLACANCNNVLTNVSKPFEVLIKNALKNKKEDL